MSENNINISLITLSRAGKCDENHLSLRLKKLSGVKRRAKEVTELFSYPFAFCGALLRRLTDLRKGYPICTYKQTTLFCKESARVVVKLQRSRVMFGAKGIPLQQS